MRLEAKGLQAPTKLKIFQKLPEGPDVHYKEKKLHFDDLIIFQIPEGPDDHRTIRR